MKKRIQEDLKRAMREGDALKTGTLRMLLAALVNEEKEKSQEGLSGEKVQRVLGVEAKKRKEAADAFEKGGRPEMAAKERKELEIIQAYLPEQMGADEIGKLVKEAIAATGASGSQDIGKVMAELMPKLKGKADGALVSSLVKELLGG